MNCIECYLDRQVVLCLFQTTPTVMSGLSLTNKTIRKLALTIFHQNNLTLLKAFPTIFEDVDMTNITSENAINFFMRFVNDLHFEARRLNCDLPYPNQAKLPTLDKMDRLTWECTYNLSLIKKLQNAMEMSKNQDFNTFVEVISKEVNISISESTDRKKFWANDLRNEKKIGDMKNLEIVNKKMKFLPHEIATLFNLQEVCLSCNDLVGLPIEVSSQSKLKLINLNNNKLKKIPVALASLPNLRHLMIINNDLQECTTLKFLTNLESLDLSHNPLSKIPHELSHLKNLTHLDLNNAQLKEMSDDLTELTSLSFLSLKANQLKEISKKHIKLEKLKNLDLRQNPLSDNTITLLKSMNKNPLNLDINFLNITFDLKFVAEINSEMC